MVRIDRPETHRATRDDRRDRQARAKKAFATIIQTAMKIAKDNSVDAVKLAAAFQNRSYQKKVRDLFKTGVSTFSNPSASSSRSSNTAPNPSTSSSSSTNRTSTSYNWKEESLTSPFAFLAAHSATGPKKRMSFAGLLSVTKLSKEVTIQFTGGQKTTLLIKKGSLLHNEVKFDKYCTDGTRVVIKNVIRGKFEGDRVCLVFDEKSAIHRLRDVTFQEIRDFNVSLDQEVYASSSMSDCSSQFGGSNLGDDDDGDNDDDDEVMSNASSEGIHFTIY